MNELILAAAFLAVADAKMEVAKVEEKYDPLQAGRIEKVMRRDVQFSDASREREIPLRVYWAKGEGPIPVVLFSHGLGGSRENSGYVANHWAARGFAVVVMQHAGSDSAVWKDVPRAKRLEAMKSAASGKQFMARVEDVPAVVDQLAKWNGQEGHFLHGKLDLEKIGMSGHSFGAVTTQAVSGQSYGPAGQRFTDERIDAALAFSPSPPNAGDPAKAFGKVKIPWMLMTGTKDTSVVVSRTTPEKRMNVYPHLPVGDKYELVLKGAEHMAFSDRTLRGQEHRNPNHHKVIKALSTAFWEAYLKGNEEAKAWLDGKAPRVLMEDGDRWQRK